MIEQTSEEKKMSQLIQRSVVETILFRTTRKEKISRNNRIRRILIQAKYLKNLAKYSDDIMEKNSAHERYNVMRRQYFFLNLEILPL